VPSKARTLLFLAIAAAAFAIATPLDPWIYHHVSMPNVYEKDWGRALRTMGYWPLWIIVAIAFWLHGRPSAIAAWRGWSLAFSVSAAGLLCEVLKMLARRERPGAHDGAYAFRPYSDHFFNTSGLGLPSSHAFLAFAASATLARLFPRTACIWYALATGCAVTRLLAGAHFLTDVVAGAVLGIVVASLVDRRKQALT